MYSLRCGSLSSMGGRRTVEEIHNIMCDISGLLETALQEPTFNYQHHCGKTYLALMCVQIKKLHSLKVSFQCVTLPFAVWVSK